MGSRLARRVAIATLAASLTTLSGTRAARADDTARNGTWQAVSTVTAVAALGSQLVMPRIFYSDPETTVGWKGRWHVSALAPLMTTAAIVLLNEVALKDAVGAFRPGCDDANQNIDPHCHDFQTLSSHAFAGFSALGHGAAVFFVDTSKWSGGRFNGAAFAGDVGMPLVLAAVTSIGRSAGHWEGTGNVVASSAAGLGVGVLLGLTYAMMQRPECGYTGELICW